MPHPPPSHPVEDDVSRASDQPVAVELAKAFHELAKGEHAASALESRLSDIESRIDQLLASVEQDVPRTEQAPSTESSSSTKRK